MEGLGSGLWGLPTVNPINPELQRVHVMGHIIDSIILDIRITIIIILTALILLIVTIIIISAPFLHLQY